MSKKKGIPLHEWQKIARVESVRADLSEPATVADTGWDINASVYLNEPAREALQPYLDDSGKTPDAS